MNLGELAYKASLDSKGFTAPLQGCQQAVNSAVGGIQSAFAEITSAMSVLGVSFAAFKSVQGVAEEFKSVFQAGKDLKVMSAMTGQTIKDLVILKKAFKDAGIEDSLETNLIRLQKSLGGVNEEGQPTVFMFQRLGLNMDQLKKMTAAQQFDAIGKAINKLPNQADKAAAAMAIFGRQGASMLALFSNGKASGDASKSAGAMGEIYQRNADLFAKVSTDLGAVAGKMKGIFVGMAAPVAELLLPLLEKLKSINTVKFGQEIGNAIKILKAAFSSGDLFELLVLELQVASNMFVNSLSGGLLGVAYAFGTLFKGEVGAITAVLTNFPTYLSALKDGFIGVAESFGAALLDVFHKPITALQAGMEYASQEMLNGMTQFTAKFAGVPETAKMAIRAMAPGVGAMLDVADKMGSGVDQVHESYDDKYNRINKEGPTMFGKGKDELYEASYQHLKKSGESFSQLADIAGVKNLIGDVMASLKEGMKVGGQAIDGSEAQAKLSQMLSKLQKLVPADKPISETKQVTGPSGSNPLQGSFAGGSKAEMEGDKLSKIGLFVGGNTRTMDYLRAMADNTAKLVSLMTPHGTGHTRDGGQVPAWS